MPQIFAPRADRILRGILLAIVLGVAVAAPVLLGLVRTDQWRASATVPPELGLRFNHARHVGDIGLDCRHCHAAVERAAAAGLPSARTCMSCHVPVASPPAIEPGAGWRRAAMLPPFIRFDHSIHLARGVACETCHGRVDQMERIQLVQPFTMAWCLDCHRDPGSHLRPREALFAMGWQPAAASAAGAHDLLTEWGVVSSGELTHCNVCHY